MNNLLCRGNCGLPKKYGNWCSEKFSDCVGYRKKLSEKAILRGPHKFLHVYSADDISLMNINFKCSVCGFDICKKIKKYLFKQDRYTKICEKCVRKQVSNSLKQRYILKDKNKKYEELATTKRKIIVWEEQKHKCTQCGLDKYLDWRNSPFEFHHKDNNWKNHKRENEEFICLNCHYFTKNYKFRGRHHTEETKQLLKKNWKRKGEGISKYCRHTV